MLEDRAGHLWFAAWGGLVVFKGVSRYDGKAFTNFSEPEGLANDVVSSLLQDRLGHVWLTASTLKPSLLPITAGIWAR